MRGSVKCVTLTESLILTYGLTKIRDSPLVKTLTEKGELDSYHPSIKTLRHT